MRKRIARAHLVARREEEEGSAGAVRDAKLAQRVHHRLHAVMVGGHGEHAKGFPSEMLLVLFRGVRSENARIFRSKLVCRKSERAMGMVPRSISTMKWWRELLASVSPNTKSGTSPMSCMTPTRERDPQREWIAGGNALSGKAAISSAGTGWS